LFALIDPHHSSKIELYKFDLSLTWSNLSTTTFATINSPIDAGNSSNTIQLFHK